MLKYVVALVLVAVLTPDTQACGRGPMSRVFAAQRMVVRAPATVATAPFRWFSGRERVRERYTFRATARSAPRVVVPCVPTTVVVPPSIPVPMPPKK